MTREIDGDDLEMFTQRLELRTPVGRIARPTVNQ